MPAKQGFSSLPRPWPGQLLKSYSKIYTMIHSMKNIALLLLLTLVSFSFTPTAEEAPPVLQGAWSLNTMANDKAVTHVLVLSGDYFSWTVHETANGAFVMTKGGTWSKTGKKLSLAYEFHTADSTQVGQAESLKLIAKGSNILLKGKGQPKGRWTDLDQGKLTPLNGAWLISGRKRNGEIRRNRTDRPRKTMKILSGTRFQWIAYNTETKQFFGTGGGTYTAENGVYQENIGFFSRDDSRVGATLKFEFAVQDGDWIHSGKSSKGAPLYEIWSQR